MFQAEVKLQQAGNTADLEAKIAAVAAKSSVSALSEYVLYAVNCM